MSLRRFTQVLRIAMVWIVILSLAVDTASACWWLKCRRARRSCQPVCCDSSGSTSYEAGETAGGAPTEATPPTDDGWRPQEGGDVVESEGGDDEGGTIPAELVLPVDEDPETMTDDDPLDELFVEGEETGEAPVEETGEETDPVDEEDLFGDLEEEMIEEEVVEEEPGDEDLFGEEEATDPVEEEDLFGDEEEPVEEEDLFGPLDEEETVEEEEDLFGPLDEEEVIEEETDDLGEDLFGPADEEEDQFGPLDEEEVMEEETDDLGASEEDDLFGPAEEEEDLFGPLDEEEPAAEEELGDETDLFGPADEEEVMEEEDATDDLFGPLDEEPVEEPAEESDDDLDDLFGAAPVPAEALGMRTWVDNTGLYETQGRLLVIGEDYVQLLKDNGNTTTVPMRRLSDADRALVEQVIAVYGLGEIDLVASR